MGDLSRAGSLFALAKARLASLSICPGKGEVGEVGVACVLLIQRGIVGGPIPCGCLLS